AAVGGHEPDESVDQLVYVAEGAGLFPRAVDGQLLTPQRLHDEVGDDPAVVLRHTGPVGIEDPGDADIDLVLPMVVHHQGFGDALAFVVTGAGTDGIDVAPVALGLRMYRGVAVHLGGRCLKNPGSEALG